MYENNRKYTQIRGNAQKYDKNSTYGPQKALICALPDDAKTRKHTMENAYFAPLTIPDFDS